MAKVIKIIFGEKIQTQNITMVNSDKKNEQGFCKDMEEKYCIVYEKRKRNTKIRTYK